MPIVNNVQNFAYNQIFGTPGRETLGRGSPRHGRNSSNTRGHNTNNQPSSAESNVQPPSTSSSRLNITRSIYILPHDTIWIDKGGNTLPFVKSWPLDSPSVLVSLSGTTKYEGFVHPFPTDSVEHGIAIAFAKAFTQSTTNSYVGLFYKKTKKIKRMRSERGYYLESYFKVKWAWFETILANINLVYCPESTVLRQWAVNTYMRRLKVGQNSSIRSMPLILFIDVPASVAAQQTPSHVPQPR